MTIVQSQPNLTHLTPSVIYDEETASTETNAKRYNKNDLIRFYESGSLHIIIKKLETEIARKYWGVNNNEGTYSYKVRPLDTFPTPKIPNPELYIKEPCFWTGENNIYDKIPTELAIQIKLEVSSLALKAFDLNR